MYEKEEEGLKRIQNNDNGRSRIRNKKRND